MSLSQPLTQILPESQLEYPPPPPQQQHPTNPDAGHPCGRIVGLYSNIKTDIWLYTKSRPIVIGRHNSCDIVISSEFSSNRHCRIYVAGPEEAGVSEDEPVVFCHDDSTNGTFCDGRRIGKGKRIMLSNNNLIEIRRGIYFLFFRASRKPGSMQCGDMSVPADVDEKYQIFPRILGSGTFAQVRLAASRTTGTPLAVKIVDKTKWPAGYAAKCGTDFTREIEILKMANHPNIIHIVDVMESPKLVFMFLELVRGGDLFELIERHKSVPETEARFLFYQTLLAVKYLHEHNIAHRDIKPENILVDGKNNPRLLLTDFGMARHVAGNHAMGTLCGTWLYCAPEIVGADPYSRTHSDIGYGMPVDCWSLGVLLYVMLSGTLPFYTEHNSQASNVCTSSDVATAEREADQQLFSRITRGRVDFPQRSWAGISEQAKSLIRRLLCVNPTLRYTVHECLSHSWISDHVVTLQKSYFQRVESRQTVMCPRSLPKVAETTRKMFVRSEEGGEFASEGDTVVPDVN